MLLRLIKSLVILLCMTILYLAIFFGLKITLGQSDEWVLLVLLNQDFVTQDDLQANLQFAEELLGEIDILALVLLSISAVASFVWLVFANLIRVSRPGIAKRYIWVWLVGIGIGCFASIFYSAYFAFEVTDLISTSMRSMFPAVRALVFVAGYTVFGTFFATPKLMRPAVPIISILFR